MTEDTMRANAQQDARMDAAIAEQKELWRKAGYRIDNGRSNAVRLGEHYIR